MPDFVAYNSRWRLALLFAFAVGFVALGTLPTGLLGEVPSFTDSPRRRLPPEVEVSVGWACIAFSGLCAVATGKRFFHGKVQLAIGVNGIISSQWSEKLIPWSEITNVSTWSHKRQKMIILHLKNPDQFPGRGLAGKLTFANRVLTRGDLAISLTGTDRSFDEAMSAIEEFRSASTYH